MEIFSQISNNFYYSPLSFKGAFIFYIISLIAYISIFFSDKKILQQVAPLLFVVASAFTTYFIVDRWIEAGRPPFKSLYESLMYAAFMVSMINSVIQYKYKLRILSVSVILLVLSIFIYAMIKKDIEIITLPPALSTWIFIPHVSAYFLAYGSMAIGGITAILSLIYRNGVRGHRGVGDDTHIHFSTYTYEIAKFGFLLQTIALLLGSFWGHEAWSNYWAWDPKENWALVSWFIFIIYLHLGKTKKLKDKAMSWVFIIGVLAILFTYLGMDLLPTADQSLHIYIEE